MYKVTKYPHGAFCWADNSSTDPEVAKAFYMDLFGWGKDDMPIGEGMTYTMFTKDGETVAALSGLSPELLERGIPSHWSNYVAVDNVDALVDKITDNGGNILVGPMDVFDSGRTMFIQDPTGAQLGLWQARNYIGAGIVNAVGAMCWNELCTNDTEAAIAFYSALLGWEFYGDEHYIHISNRGRNNGGMIQLDNMTPGWMPYFHVASINDAMKRVEALGGTVVVGKHEAPDTGWWSVVRDPAGAHFYVMQLLKAEPWVE